MSVFTLDGHLFREMIINAASLLEKSRAGIDALNVFPVPDGDTGTNMSLTMTFAAREVEHTQSGNIGEVAETVAKGALKGARGNSGVILSQLLRGFARSADHKETLTPIEFAQALKAGADTAYKAVMKPREGTMLTVARVIAEDMLKIKQFTDFQTLFAEIIRSGEAILRKTPDMLPVLKQAGVVDAGGKGLLTIYLGYNMALNGQELTLDKEFEATGPLDAMAIGAVEEEGIEFAYCTEFFVRNIEGDADQKADTLREALMGIGDCVLVVGDSDMLKVHVHSNHPGQALEFAVEIGTLHGLKIDNMREQHRTIIEEAKPLNEAPKVPYALIAVAAGEGISGVFKDLGVHEVIFGGQTMNPPTDAFLKAIEKANAKTVFILPNNSNIIWAAQQAADLTEGCDVKVIPTKTIPQGISAVLAFMPDNSPESNFESMCESSEAIKSGKVTYAVRSSTIDDKQINEGDILGMIESDLAVVGSDADDVLMQCLSSMVDENSGVITVFYGEDIDNEKGQALRTKIEEAYPDCDVEVLSGKQPVYYYIFSVE